MCSNLTLQETTVYEHFPGPGPAVGTLGSQALPEGVVPRKRGPGDSTGTQSRAPSKTAVFLKVRNSYVFHKSEAESGGVRTQRPLLLTTGPRCCCRPQALGAAADHSTEFRESIARPASHLHDNSSEVPLGWAMSAHQRFSKWASRHGYKVIFPGILSSPSPRRKHRSLKFCSFFHNHGNMLKPSI